VKLELPQQISWLVPYLQCTQRRRGSESAHAGRGGWPPAQAAVFGGARAIFFLLKKNDILGGAAVVSCEKYDGLGRDSVNLMGVFVNLARRVFHNRVYRLMFLPAGPLLAFYCYTNLTLTDGEIRKKKNPASSVVLAMVTIRTPLLFQALAKEFSDQLCWRWSYTYFFTIEDKL
jgi:hypothetical protein